MAPRSGRSAPPDRTGQPSKPGTALVLRNEPSAKRSPTGSGNELADFAKDLRELRTEAGLGYPEMAELSHYTMKTLAAAAGGLALPTLPVTAAYVRACDGNVAVWEDRWHLIADAMKPDSQGAGPQPGAAPDGAPGSGNGSGGRATGGAAKIRGAHGTGQASGTGQPSGTGQADRDRTQPGPEAPGPHDQRKPSRPSQVSSPRPAHEGPPAPGLAPPPPDKKTEQVYVITSAAPRRPYR
jgi:hypothetical protein